MVFINKRHCYVHKSGKHVDRHFKGQGLKAAVYKESLNSTSSIPQDSNLEKLRESLSNLAISKKSKGSGMMKKTKYISFD